MQKKSFITPDQVMTPPKTKVEVIKIGDEPIVAIDAGSAIYPKS